MKEKILQGEIGFDITIADFQNTESVLINSVGGSLFEGLAMYDYVIGNDIEVGIIGVCASAATLPLIASKKPWGTPNSRYLIHNPWNMEIGDAAAMEKTAKELRAEQERALNLYVTHLNGSKDELQALMNEERIIDAEEALKLGLIKEIKNINQGSDKPEGSDIKNLFTNFKMQIDMQKEDKEKLSGIESKLDKLISSMKAWFSPKNIIIQDTNGVELEFPEAETEEQIAVNMPVNVNGEAGQTGEYTKDDGTVYVVADGVLTEIKPASGGDEEMEALKAENADLKEQLASIQNSLTTVEGERDGLKASLRDVSAQVETVKNELSSFKNKFSDDKPKPNAPASKNDGGKKKFSYKKK